MKKILFIAIISLGFPLSLFAQGLTTSYAPTSYASECVNLTYNLRLGSRDVSTEYQVSALQDFLSPKYLYLPVGPTGYFGAATLAAAKRFQGDYGISQTGYVGPITRAKIRELTCSGGGWGGACPMDVKICPDGRAVSRIPPTCEFAACSGVPTQQAPIINSIYPSQVPIGSSVTISGSGFASLNNEIYLNNQPAGQAYLTGANTLTFTVPRTIGTPCPQYVYCIQGARELTPGTYSVKVTNANGTSNSVNLTITGTTVVVPPITPPNPPTVPTSFSSSVTSGTAPLSVQFYADRQVTSCDSSVPFSVDFGDGSPLTRMEINGISYPTTNWGTTGTPCGGYFTTHTYTQPGTYTARLYKTIYNSCTPTYGTVCPLWASREDQVGSITITVTQTQLQTPVITSVYSVRTNATGTIYIGEESRITGSNLALIFPSSGIGARLDVQIGGMNVSPFNIMGTSLSFTTPNLIPGTYTVTVTNSSGVSNPYSVTVANTADFCQKDAKICPDGSVVSRVYPTCEFAACPATPSGPAITSLTGEGSTGTTGSILYVGRKGHVSWRGVSADRINIGGQTAPITITAIAMPSCIQGADCSNSTMYMGEFTVPNLSEGTYSAFLITPNNTNGPSLYPVSVKVTSVVNVGPTISSIGGQSQSGAYGTILYPGRKSFVSWKGMSADRITIGTQTAPITIIAIAMPTCVNQGPCDATTLYSGEFTTPAMANGLYSAFLITSQNINGPAYYPVTIQNQ